MAVIRKILIWLWGAFLLFVISYYVTRIFFVDSFIVRGSSMNPQYKDGEKVYVNKLIFGARLYTDFDFESSKLKSVRMPGLRKIRVGDVVVLNHPFGRTGDTINFKINYVYLKRCFGCPGDTLWIKDGMYANSNVVGNIGELKYQEKLRSTPDSILLERGVAMSAFLINKELGWNIKNLGPIYIPGKGDCITININNVNTYRKLIQYECGTMPEIIDNKVYLGDSLLQRYTFSSNWYFFGGDNVLNSQDSRYLGLMPEEYIIGVVTGEGTGGIYKFNIYPIM